MLIQFTVENWMSFRDKTEFSMVASREQQHGDRLRKLDKHRMRLLPAACIYGGNASGKTNICKAIAFAQNFILQGLPLNVPILTEPFSLDSAHRNSPTSFTFVILVGEQIYDFSFSINSKQVIEEKLVAVNSTGEKVLYHRNGKDTNQSIHSSMINNRLRFAFQGTRHNQLFLTNSVFQQLSEFMPVYDWFMNSLMLLGPDSRFAAIDKFERKNSPLYETMNTLLPDLDTGISRLGAETIPLENADFSPEIQERINNFLAEGEVVKAGNPLGDKLLVSRENGKIIVKKLFTYHKSEHGKEVKFDMKMESDGSKRIIDLLPAFIELANLRSKKVLIIDEIDRSLHPLLIEKLLEKYLDSCSAETNKQLIMTTHNLSLMDQSIFRRDEIWITERKSDGSSKLVSFAEFNEIRNDKDIRKSYRQGRMGGVPMLAEGLQLYSGKGNTKNK